MASPLAGRSVLVVEDEMIVAWMLEDMLTDLGCIVVGPAASVERALALIEAEVVDAATLDINLGGEMSYPIADLLAARGTPFVFCTGYARDRLRAGYGAFPVLQKPYHPSELGEALERLMAPTPVAAPSTSAANAPASA